MKLTLVIALITAVVGHTSAKDCDPDILEKNVCTSSTLILSTSKVTVDNSNCNETFKAQDFTEKPKIKWTKASKDQRYAFLLVGTNLHYHMSTGKSPTDYKFYFEGSSVYFHWAVSDISISTLLEDGEISRHNQIAEFQPLIRTSGSVKSYRYQAFIFRHKKFFKGSSQPPKVTPARVNFNLTKFIEELELECEVMAAIQAWIDPKSLEINF